MSQTVYSVAVDGPAGAGKSSLAKFVAAQLGIVYVDTGAIYRSIGYYAFKNGVDPTNTEAMIASLPSIHIEMGYGEDGLQRMYLNGEDVTKEIRLPEISRYASCVSAIGEVRAFLLDMQRDMAKKTSVIMDGRDIGTVVLPDADVKIYLTASSAVRAQRRMLELEQRGTPLAYETVLKEIEDRDWADMHRDVAPLRQAEDAIVVDTSDLSLDESRAKLLEVIQGRLAK